MKHIGLLSVVLALAICSIPARKAGAADVKFDLAEDNLVKAIALVEAAEVPNQCKFQPEVAVFLMEQAEKWIEYAKSCSDHAQPK